MQISPKIILENPIGGGVVLEIKSWDLESMKSLTKQGTNDFLATHLEGSRGPLSGRDPQIGERWVTLTWLASQVLARGLQHSHHRVNL